jgi:hypothetical protein
MRSAMGSAWVGGGRLGRGCERIGGEPAGWRVRDAPLEHPRELGERDHARLEGITGDDDEVGDLADLDRADPIVDAEQPRGA